MVAVVSGVGLVKPLTDEEAETLARLDSLIATGKASPHQAAKAFTLRLRKAKAGIEIRGPITYQEMMEIADKVIRTSPEGDPRKASIVPFKKAMLLRGRSQKEIYGVWFRALLRVVGAPPQATFSEMVHLAKEHIRAKPSIHASEMSIFPFVDEMLSRGQTKKTIEKAWHRAMREERPEQVRYNGVDTGEGDW
jgi:hypothetical protein